MKRLLLQWVFRLGLLTAWHRWRNRHTLTVLIFHRVIPFDTTQPQSTWPSYTVTPAFFEQCLDFLQQHYHLVSLQQTLDAMRGGGALPSCSLLITFDDGWLDTSQFAQPILSRRNCPAVLFAVGSLGDGQEFWHESVLRCFHSGTLAPVTLLSLWQESGDSDPAPANWSEQSSIWQLLARLQALPEDSRRHCLARAGLPSPQCGVMMTGADLQRFAAGPRAVGAHGFSHLPLTVSPDAAAELRNSRQYLRRILGDTSPVDTMSWPHGKYTAALTREAFAAGYHCLFTSDQILNLATAGRPSPLLGRYEVTMADVADAAGNLRPERLANALFRLPIAALREDQ